MQQTVEEWAKYVIERWEQEIIRLRVSRTNQLLNSFKNFVITQSNGNVEKIEFVFEYYGKFVDMGVGNGVKMGEVEYSNRKPKPWYNKVFFGQVKKLGELLAEQYQYEAAMIIATNVESFNEDGSRIAPIKKSGEKVRYDKVTGKKKMTWKEFERQNKDKSWWKG